MRSALMTGSDCPRSLRRLGQTSLICFFFLGAQMVNSPVLAVPGLNSSDSVKKIVDMIKVYSERTQNVNVYDLEKELRNRPRQAAQALVDLLDTNNRNVQLQAASVLERLSTNPDFSISDSSLKTLIAILRGSKEPEVKASLVRVLGNIGPKNEDVKAAIIENISGDAEATTKRNAIEALAKLAQQEKPEFHRKSTEILVGILRGDDAPSLRKAAAIALSRYHNDPEVAVPALIDALNDNYLLVRTAAVQAIGNYHSGAEAAVPPLLKLLEEEPNEGIRSSSIYTLRTIGKDDQRVVDKFIELLDDPKLGRSIMSYLYYFGDRAAPAVPKLIKMLDSSDRYQRQYACRALGAIGIDAKEALPALEKATRDSDASVRSNAQTAINNINRINGNGSM
ncbi:MAG TPA: HEAT repeat domain-containing protein [Candidatus Melainabacteria bacterium]|nr:HEAT repeat domain-containing protein [Candidatus Melainabacteria bacterium]